MEKVNTGNNWRIPLHGWAGLAVCLPAWALSWGLEGLRTHYLFFPQWLGYCLLVDALVAGRTGSSRLTRNPKSYILLFVASVPVWWIFEGLNLVTRNWHYLGREEFSDWSYFLWSSLSFSTVIPAVFGTADLLASFPVFSKCAWTRPFPLGRPGLLRLHLAGWLMLLLMLAFPDIFFPFMWLSLFFILDPLNGLRGRSSLFMELSRGRLRMLLCYGLGALVCGFFWELWNIYAYPKWVYDIPYLEFWHIFEMPLAGYGGYLPFGWELYAVGALLTRPR